MNFYFFLWTNWFTKGKTSSKKGLRFSIYYLVLEENMTENWASLLLNPPKIKESNKVSLQQNVFFNSIHVQKLFYIHYVLKMPLQHIKLRYIHTFWVATKTFFTFRMIWIGIMHSIKHRNTMCYIYDLQSVILTCS